MTPRGIDAHSKIVDVLIVVDAISLTKDGHGQNSTSDTPAVCNPPWAAMMTSFDHVVSGNATADLHIKAARGDVLHISSISVGNQFDYAVFAYDFRHRSGDHVLDTMGMKNQMVTGFVIEPDPDQAVHDPPKVKFSNGNFYIEKIGVSNAGQECIHVKFVVYGQPGGDSRPVLGYFQWNASITVTEP